MSYFPVYIYTYYILLEATKQIGLEINDEKPYYIIIQRRGLLDDEHTHLEKGEYKFKREIVQEFKYLESCITQKNN